MFCSEVVPSRNGQKQKNSIGALHVRFAPESGHRATGLAGPLCANRVLMRRSKRHPYSIISSARRLPPGGAFAG
jgi:hypothetical protein